VLREKEREMNFNILTIRHLIDLLKLTNGDNTASIKSLDALTHLDFTIALNKVIKITQEKWLRPVGKERWDLEDSPLLIAQRDNIINLLKKLGFIDEVQPSFKAYESILLLGASDINLVERINYLPKIWKLGVRYKKCYLLTGGNVLKNSTHLTDIPKTDTDIIIETYKQLSQDWPHLMRQVEVIPIIVKSKLPRPNTRDTLNTWLERKEKRTNLLVISNQPFIPYQNLVTKSVLKTHYQFETVGNPANSSMLISIMLDSVARCLYEYSFGMN
jgi:hypothetical protein